MTQEWAVGVIVAIAAMYVLWRWMPSGLRRRLGRVHPAMEKAAGCGGCSSCGGCGSADTNAAGNKASAEHAPHGALAMPEEGRPMLMPKQRRSRP